MPGRLSHTVTEEAAREPVFWTLSTKVIWSPALETKRGELDLDKASTA